MDNLEPFSREMQLKLIHVTELGDTVQTILRHNTVFSDDVMVTLLTLIECKQWLKIIFIASRYQDIALIIQT
jgi:hypothetical protein